MAAKFIINFDSIFCGNTTLQRGMWHVHMIVMTLVTFPFDLQVHSQSPYEITANV